MVDAPRVQVTESGQGVSFAAPRSNAAMDLAQSLSGVSSELNQFLPVLGKQLEDKQRAKATQDALASSGKAFADAVREGKIEPTQNPWYIQHYEEQAAQVRGQGDANNLYAQSQTWAERNDPVKFSQRWAEESGKLGKAYVNGDQQAGFAKALAPISAQALQANVQYNVQRIQQDNIQATSTNMTAAIEGIIRVNPNATAKDFYGALDDSERAWISTGGTEEQFALMTKGAIVAAAYKSVNPKLLDVLNDDRGGKGAISSMFNEKGQSLAEEIATDKYRIGEAANAALMGDAKVQKAQREAAGYRLYNWAYANIPTDDLLKGNFNFHDMVEKLKTATDPETKQPFTGPAIQAALAIFGEEQAKDNSLQRSLIDQYSNSPESAQRILNLTARTLKEGLTPAIEAEIHSAVRLGQIDANKATALLDKAASTSARFQSEGRADARQARADAKDERRYRLQADVDLKDRVGLLVGNATNALAGAGSPVLARDPAKRATFTRQVGAAADAHLYAHPGDYAGANKAAEDAANRLLLPELAKARAAADRKKTTGGGSGNALRSGSK